MKIKIDWETFHSRFYNQNTVFVKEHDTYFEFYTFEGIFSIYTTKDKSENAEENIIFIERYMTDKKNLCKVLSFEEDNAETTEQPLAPEINNPIEYKQNDI